LGHERRDMNVRMTRGGSRLRFGSTARRPQLLNRRPRSPSLRTGGGCGRRYSTRSVIRRTRRNETVCAYAQHRPAKQRSRHAISEANSLRLTTASPYQAAAPRRPIFAFLKCCTARVALAFARKGETLRAPKLGGATP
jgi:hypothetical protein